MDHMVIRAQDTGLELPPPPPFGRQGSWPPVATEWVPIRWELFEAQVPSVDLFSIAANALALIPDDASLPVAAPVLKEDPLSNDFLYEAFFAKVTDISMMTSIASRKVNIHIEYAPHSGRKDRMLEYSGKKMHKELRRLVYYSRWRRQDPPVRLPPKGHYTVRYSVTTDISVEQSQALAGSLGLSFGSNAVGAQAKLGSQLQQRLGVKIAAQEGRDRELSLFNPSYNRTRLFALWHREHLMSIDALSAAIGVGDFRPVWVTRDSIGFMEDTDPHVIHTDVDGT